jgi:hypothetical protein
MTRSNRVVNRALLILVGLVATLFGLALVAPTLGMQLPEIAAPTTPFLWWVAGGCLAVVILSLLWIVSRGRGRIPTIIQQSDASGSTTVDVRVTADLISEALADSPDILSVGAGAYRMRGSRVLSLRVDVRRGADLARVVGRVGTTIEALDGALETRIPVLLQVVSGVRASFTHENRTR